MFRLSIRNLAAKKLRLLTTALAIVLGVAFTTGTMILSDTMRASLTSAIDTMASGVDTVVRGPEIADGTAASGTAYRAPVPADELEVVRSLPAVDAAAPYYNGYAQVIGTDGKAIETTGSAGLNWIGDPKLSMFELASGSAPASGEVVLGDRAARAAKVEVGDRVDLITTLGRETFTVSGIARLQGGVDFGDASFTFFSDTDAADRLADPGTMTAIVARSDSLEEGALTAEIAKAVPDQDVITGTVLSADQKDEVSGQIGVFGTILMVFGGIALLVGSFTIANTFSITIAQRTKELALVRAIGASQRQVLGSVLAEAGLLGTVAAVLGLLGGLGVATALTALFGTLGLQFPARALVVSPTTVIVGMAAGIGVTVVAALVPARRAARVAPVDAMRDATMERTTAPLPRVILGTVLAFAGAAALAVGVQDKAATMVGVGTIGVFLAAIALGPVLLRPVGSVLASPFRRAGVSGRLASANALRNPKRSATTAAALMIGVMLVAGASMFAQTARQTILGDTDRVIVADRVVRPIGANPGVPTDVAATVAAVPGTSVLPMRRGDVAIGNGFAALGAVDLDRVDGFLDLRVVGGAITGERDAVVVGDREAADRGWGVGTPLTITFLDGQTADVRVGAIVEQRSALPTVLASYDLVAPHLPLDSLALVNGDAATLQAADAALAEVPTATLDSPAGYARHLASGLDMVLNLVVGFLGLAVVIAVLGIATTIGLSVHERTRELGMLRAVGMSRRQLRRSIRFEAIVIALFGTAVGLAMGVGCTWAALTTLSEKGFAAPVVPGATLVMITVGALLAGTVAAALPARRASRIAVLDAVRTA
jgi:putative ABC transport system permease protein